MTLNKEQRMNKFFMDVAERTSLNSFAKRAKVGAVIVKDGRIIATGWNGQPTGLPNECEFLNSKNELETKSTVIHAEANVISFCSKYGISTNDTVLYLTLSPCINCALLIIQAGIKKVYYKQLYHNNLDVINFLRNCNIEIDQLK